MRFGPDAATGGFDAASDTQALYPKHVAGRSETDQV